MPEEVMVNHGAEEGALVESVAGNLPMNQGEPEQAKNYSDDELNKMLTAEGDRRVEKALKTFKEKELPKLIEAARQEAERLARMDEEQRAEFKLQKAEQELFERAEAVRLGELRLTAHRKLSERKLDICLLDALVYESEEKLDSSIDAVEKALREGIEKRVNERLRGLVPKAHSAESVYTIEQLRGMTPQFIAANMNAVERALER